MSETEQKLKWTPIADFPAKRALITFSDGNRHFKGEVSLQLASDSLPFGVVAAVAERGNQEDFEFLYRAEVERKIHSLTYQLVKEMDIPHSCKKITATIEVFGFDDPAGGVGLFGERST